MYSIEQVYPTWNVERISRHVAYWIFWILVYATMNTYKSDLTFFSWVGVELVVMIVKVPFTYFVLYFLVSKFLIKRKYLIFMILTGIASYIGSIGIMYLYQSYLFELMGIVKKKYSLSNLSFSSLFYSALDLFYIATFPVIFKLHQSYLFQEKTNQQIQEQKLRAELELLKHQLHPHFLFNTLNNLYGMVLTKHPKAADVVLHLSNMMSYMLYECNTSFIALEKEIEHLKNYIELEKIRYGNRLNISFESGGEIENQLIAPLLLIGFIENAFKHGVGNQVQQSWIRINLWVENQQLSFLIENSLNTQAPQKEEIMTKGGIGLSNIQKRLDLMYPSRYQLKIECKDTYLVHLKLNLGK
jgi:sensor histidine kinase YesM